MNVKDSTRCWKIIKEAVGQNSVINDDNCTFHINGNDVNDKQIIINEFNDYFVNIGPNLANNIINISNPIEYDNDILNSISLRYGECMSFNIEPEYCARIQLVWRLFQNYFNNC